MTHDYDTALDYLRQVQDIFDEIAELREPTQELLDLGRAAYEQNDYETALPYLKQAQQAFSELVVRLEQAKSLDRLGDAARIYDEFSVIPDYYQRIEDSQIETRIRFAQCLVPYFQGEIAEKQGNDSQTLYEQFEQTANIHGKTTRRNHTIQRLTFIAEEPDEYISIQKHYDTIIILGGLIDDLPTQLRAWRGLAKAEQQAGNLDAACEAYRKCLAVADASPVFRDHPVVAGWRREYAELNCRDAEDTETS